MTFMQHNDSEENVTPISAPGPLPAPEPGINDVIWWSKKLEASLQRETLLTSMLTVSRHETNELRSSKSVLQFKDVPLVEKYKAQRNEALVDLTAANSEVEKLTTDIFHLAYLLEIKVDALDAHATLARITEHLTQQEG